MELNLYAYCNFGKQIIENKDCNDFNEGYNQWMSAWIPFTKNSESTA